MRLRLRRKRGAITGRVAMRKSQYANAHSTNEPITSIAIMEAGSNACISVLFCFSKEGGKLRLRFCHRFCTLWLRVSGRRISDTDVPNSVSPMMSSCSAVCKALCFQERLGDRLEGGRSELAIVSSTIPSRLALLSAQKRVMIKGSSVAGTRIANIPSVNERHCELS